MDEIIAKNRFGLGINPRDNDSFQDMNWFEKQTQIYEAKPTAIKSSPNSKEIVRQYLEVQELKRKNKDNPQIFKKEAKILRDIYLSETNNRLNISVTTNTPFIERLVHFWSNHFAVSADKIEVRALAGAYENEAIRPNVLGNFRDLIRGVVTHPAMLAYLDQIQSIGPNSMAGQRRAKNNPDKEIGLNENLAREIFELHTLGVNGGYTQQDVTEFARALTGFTIANGKRKQFGNSGEIGNFVFEPLMHEPGSRTIMGKKFNQSGADQGAAILEFAASHPSTAKNIATKLARHFAGDNPPQTLIDKLKQSFISSNGDLKSIYLTLIKAPECWVTNNVKFKTSWEWLVSSLRAMGIDETSRIETPTVLENLGQTSWQPKSPKGFDDIEDAWAAPDALLRRAETANLIAKYFDAPLNPNQLAPKLLGNHLSEHTKIAISRAESIQSGIALLLISPEFLRR
ncbi:MAG: DUF1800 domain-containing protein [Proteobacteria bacterium]|nr:DUF1800 domain-containing protein [Pseudomonadota bacterium]